MFAANWPTAFLVIPHALTFPGVFAPDGLLGAGLQTTPWLNEFWFLGLPSAVIVGRLRPTCPSQFRETGMEDHCVGSGLPRVRTMLQVWSAYR